MGLEGEHGASGASAGKRNERHSRVYLLSFTCCTCSGLGTCWLLLRIFPVALPRTVLFFLPSAGRLLEGSGLRKVLPYLS